MLSQLWEKSPNWDKKSIMRYCVSENYEMKSWNYKPIMTKNIMAIFF